LKEVLQECKFSESEINSLLQKITTPEIKEILKNTTTEAIDRGAFGSPTMFIKTGNGEQKMFFWE